MSTKAVGIKSPRLTKGKCSFGNMPLRKTITNRLTCVLCAFLVLFGVVFAGCSSNSRDNGIFSKTLTITDLLVPVYENGTIVGSEPVRIRWDTASDPPIVPPAVLKVCLSEFWNQGDDVNITKAQFRESAVIPYINGLWLSRETLLRTPKMVGQMAMDNLINPVVPPDDPNFPEWPVFYPPTQGFVHDIIVKNNVEGARLDIKPLPESKPDPGSEDGATLYNHLGLLYLPNSYVVPGGTFNEMYGWDSFFIIVGLLRSATYVLENPGCQIFLEDTLRASTLDDVRTLFDIAKGMVDNHIYEINFYGGYILNANRCYYLTRSQPPLFTQEVFAVYDFYQKYKVQAGLEYTETLGPYLQTADPGFEAPENFDAWMRKEVTPAAVIYYKYWTAPDTVYKSWDPYVSAVQEANPRVVGVSESGNFVEGKSAATYVAYRYYTEGYGDAPEVTNSTQSQNRTLYLNAAEFFKCYPEENPVDTDSGEGMFWNQNSPLFANLTQAFYASDRAVRASGYDLSIRWGMTGQYATNYAQVSLNTLLYQMGKDLLVMLSQFGAYNMSDSENSTFRETISGRNETLGEVINNFMWVEDKGYYADLRVREIGTAQKHPYKYGTLFYPLWADDLVTSQGRAEVVLDTAMTEETVRQDELLFINDGSGQPENTTILWFNEQGRIYSYDLETGKISSVEAPTTPLISETPRTVYQTLKNYGIPTSLTQSGNQWDYPYSWSPVQYFAVHGLLKHFDMDAHPRASSAVTCIVEGWLEAADIFFANTGYLIEKYTCYDPAADKRVSHGYSQAQIGFGWTNAMYMEALKLHP